MMKTFSLLPVLLPLLPLCVAEETDSPAPEAPTSPQEETKEELELAVKMTLTSFQVQLDALRCMQDAASTVEAAPGLRRAMSLCYKLYNMSFDYDEYRERCTEVLGDLREACNRELERLSEVDFYGVMPVRAIFTIDKTMVAATGNRLGAADPYPEQDAKALFDSLKERIEEYLKRNTWVEGGPGTTRETAWRITATTDAIPRERHLMRCILGKSYCGQALFEVEGRFYDCLYTIVTKDGEPFRLEQWFDITPYYTAQDE